MDDAQLHILQLATFDIAGGAERVAMDLLGQYRRAGHAAGLAVGHKRGVDPDVFEFDHDARRSAWSRAWLSFEQAAGKRIGTVRGAGRVANLTRWIGQPLRQLRTAMGREDFDFPATVSSIRHFFEPVPPGRLIIHGHNLHGGYFDLRQLGSLSRIYPTVLTLHDMWMLTGHCAHGLECQRWEQGCGHCPHLETYPSTRRDATACNWRRKQGIYARSRLHVATPSHWLMDKVKRSMLWPGVMEAKVIPNGVDRSIFHPASREAARSALGLPTDTSILLFAAAGIRSNAFKDYTTLRDTVERLAAKMPGRLMFLALGEGGTENPIPGADIQFIPFEMDAKRVALYYQAADLYLHAARADTFPNSILEAMACGRAVVATNVGGIPEQVIDGKTGRLVPIGDARAMAEAALRLLEQSDLRSDMETRAAAEAESRFDLRRQAGTYLDWFQSLVRVETRTDDLHRAR